ncbi:splicing factor ATP-dependent RNA helicase [Seminavis robusta]|uniref:RNA helicase n=1 Tax=Seminavis robusta TaxID=568900 RepID=A0A9N8EN12_9STRA|nr:splicing factor ATP-dependent RNA helicase [Seminavis robusta]|eukprot:Sro1496_g277510.1 splicing factor ATP-dependent RNA helicase (732) ;mRNA; f:9978-12485
MSSLFKKRKHGASAGGDTRQSIAEARKNLPVFKFRSEFCDKIKNHEVVLVTSETGSGKSTQIPQYVLDMTSLTRAFAICVTQPRRVAAITVASRVAKERNCRLGSEVGYRVRFDDKTNPSTKLIYATDGMLLRQAMLDPLLSAYSVILLDEAHQRSLQTDVLFGACKRAMEARKKSQGKAKNLPPLKVVVMSATLDIETFLAFFQGAETIKIPGRQYPVQIIYTKEPQEDYIDAALCATLQIHEDSEEGDILVFLPGQEEIEDLALLLKSHLDETANLTKSLTGDVVQSLRGIGTDLSKTANIVNGVLVCVLYAALPPEMQMFAFQPKPEGCTRKIVLSTNIAETSVTLQGIRYIVDTGKEKSREFSSSTGMESLHVQDISKAQAAQRTGRAGRVSKGFCFRLYTEDAFETLQDTTTPEILRVNLAQVVLQLKGMGVEDPLKFEFITPPNPQSLKSACQHLFALGALDDKMQLTDYGSKLARLPLDPTFAHLLLQSEKYGCTAEILVAVSMLSAENILFRPSGDQLSEKAAEAHRRFASHEGDLPTFLNIYRAWRTEAIYTSSRKSKEKKNKESGKGKLLHGEWCRRSFISARAMSRANDVHHQLRAICTRPVDRNGLGMDVSKSCSEDMEAFLKCVCAGLFLQSAERVKETKQVDETGGVLSSTRKYRTKVGNRPVSIHPTSTLFGRNPAPKCVVYTELVTTKKTYIRGVSQIRESWLNEVAPQFFSISN